MNFKEIFELKVPRGKIALLWFNSYSGLIIKTPSETLIFDPVGIKLRDYITADAILITHEHLDHFDPGLVDRITKKTNAPVLTTPFVAQRLSVEKVKVLREGDSFIIGDSKIYAEFCDHPANQPLSFVIQSGEITIYHPSDSKPFPKMSKLKEKYKKIDILLYFGASPEEGAGIAKLVNPQTVVSYYSDKESSSKLGQLINREALETKVRMIKQFGIYLYPG